MNRKIAALALFAMLGCGRADELPPRTQPAAAPAARQADARAVILFLGTSLTAGYGVGADHAYPALIQKRLDSAGYAFRAVNAGLSGETSAGGLRRLQWSLQQPVSVLVLELGANDGLRGLPIAQLRANLDSIIARTRQRYPDVAVVIAGMQAPPNLGTPYTSQFQKTYRDIARKHDALLIPFLLEGVAADAALNQEDGIHPNAEGHRRIAALMWTALEPVLRQRSPPSPAPAARE
jgi:acyl-CoA thioesterase-1